MIDRKLFGIRLRTLVEIIGWLLYIWNAMTLVLGIVIYQGLYDDIVKNRANETRSNDDFARTIGGPIAVDAGLNTIFAVVLITGTKKKWVLLLQFWLAYTLVWNTFKFFAAYLVLMDFDQEIDYQIQMGAAEILMVYSIPCGLTGLLIFDMIMDSETHENDQIRDTRRSRRRVPLTRRN